MRPALPVALTLLLLAACGRSEDATTAAPPPPADAPAPAPAAPEPPPVDVARPLNLLGNEPFWALQIRPDGLKFSAPDHEDVTAANSGPAVRDKEAVWIGDAKGRPVKATVTLAVCQDGMSGLLYPFKAKVEIDGKVLEGCAAYADAMPREQ